MSLSKEALQYLDSSREKESIEIGGVNYVRGSFSPVKPFQPAPIGVATLSGLLDYVNKVKEVKPDLHFVHVLSLTEVEVRSKLYGKFNVRDTVLRAAYNNDRYRFGNLSNVETFILDLQSQFVETPDLIKIVKYASSVTSVMQVSADDNGVSQEVHLKKSVVEVGKEKIVNPMKLRPRVTFPVIEQPEGDYVFRISRDDDGKVSCKLIEAGDMWKRTAMNSIKSYLENNLDGWSIVA